MEQISSTTPPVDELKLQEDWDEYEMRDSHKPFDDTARFLLDKEPAAEDLMDDDILDLAGGARDAIERHKASLPRFEDPPRDTFSDFTLSGPAPSEKEPEEASLFGGFGDSTEKQTKAVDEVSDTEPAPRSREKDSSPPAAPSSYESNFSSSASSLPLIQSSAGGRKDPLGQEGDSFGLETVAPVSPLSPLHSPDSLEELSLSDSPNQAPFTSVPFGSGPVPYSQDYSQKVQDMPLGEEVKMFECKTGVDNSNITSGLNVDMMSREPNKEGLKAATYSEKDSSQFLSSFIATGKDLGSVVDPSESLLCEDSGVASSPDEKLGSSVESQDGKMDSDKEGFDKDSESGESAGSTPTRSPMNLNVTTQPYVIYASSNPTANSEAPYLDSQDNIKVIDGTTQSSFASKTSWYETDLLTGKTNTDDFLSEMKTSSASKNPFQEFSPICDSKSGFSQYGEMCSDSRPVKLSESPTPDLVQYAHDGHAQEITSTKHKDETHFDLVHMASDSVVEPSNPSLPLSVSPKESEESIAQPSLPDILESSPLSSGKQDSDLSEGSPDSEQSPIQELRMETHNVPSTQFARNPFALDTDPKMSVLKDMSVETGASGAEKTGHDVQMRLEKSVGAFDLVKEVDRYESVLSMNLPTGAPLKADPEDSDSESLNTGSLSPVLEVMERNPASFPVENEEEMKDSKVPQVKETKDFVESRMFTEKPESSEMLEQEVSSEEFEIIESPPTGIIDEFLGTPDHSKFATAPGMGADNDMSNFRQDKVVMEVGSELHEVSSYMLLGQPSSSVAPQKTEAEVGNPFAPTEEFTHQIKEAPSVSQTSLRHFTGEDHDKSAPCQKMVENIAPDKAALSDASKGAGLPSLSFEAVVDLLYWRDLKKTGAVFGASLFLLLSLTVCSIVSICSYVALALLSVTITFRIYKGILQAIQKSEEGHPFKAYLDQDVDLSQEIVHKYSDMTLARINSGLKELRRLFLVEDLVDSLKFAVLMWILTYVGALFNGLTLLILGLISAFSLPVVYEKYQTQIDHYYGLFNNQVKDIVGKIQDKVPGLKRKSE